jgi:hypothetical protein
VAYDSNTTEELTDMAEVNVNLKKPLEGRVLQVSLSLKVTREFKLRLWVGKILLFAATRALGAGIEFTKPTPPTDKELVDIDGLVSNLAASKIRKALDTASDNPNKVVKCAGTLLIGERGTIAELRKAPATVRLPCGCYDVCTDQRPGHPSSDQSLDSWRDDYSPTASQHWCGDAAGGCAELAAVTNAPRSLYTDATHCKCGTLLWFTKERESGVCTGCADHEFRKRTLQQNGSN